MTIPARLPLPEPSNAPGFNPEQREYLVRLTEILQWLVRQIRDKEAILPGPTTGTITLNGTWRLWVDPADDTLHVQHLESAVWVDYNVFSQNAM